MTDAEEKQLLRLVESLRERGVSHFEADEKGGFKVDLLPPEPKQEKRAESKPIDKCNCGHHVAEHNGGMCLNGCEIEACIGKAANG